MAKCAYCGTYILFGGERDGSRRYCNAKCRQAGFMVVVADHVPPEDLAEQLSLWHNSNCPKCGGTGPVDVHTSHRIWSALFMTSWSSRPEVCCRRCGIRAKLGDRRLVGLSLGSDRHADPDFPQRAGDGDDARRQPAIALIGKHGPLAHRRPDDRRRSSGTAATPTKYACQRTWPRDPAVTALPCSDGSIGLQRVVLCQQEPALMFNLPMLPIQMQIENAG